MINGTLTLALGCADVIALYDYRAAEVQDLIFKADYGTDDIPDLLQKKWARHFNHTPDNHECYKIKLNNTYYIQFSDWHMYIGTEIKLT
jgi:hypothetical protein